MDPHQRRLVDDDIGSCRDQAGCLPFTTGGRVYRRLPDAQFRQQSLVRMSAIIGGAYYVDGSEKTLSGCGRPSSLRAST